jgi:protein-L-isoaspartate(D-aspartate) O-methyltransferase
MALDPVREQMVLQQVRAWDVLDDRVLGILRDLPREEFVPESYRAVAYADTAIPLGHGQHMLAPKVVGRILQALALRPLDRVLEVGTGSGYLTAALAAAACSVRSLEIHEDLAERARSVLARLEVRNAEVVVADGLELAESPGYHVIVVTGSVPRYESRFERALEVGGRLFMVVGEPPVMDALLVRRVTEAAWARESLFETNLDPLVHAPHRPRFVF